MNIVKTKSQLRTESQAQMAAFLARGGVVEVSDRQVRPRKQVMRGKVTRNASKGSSGFAAGFPRKTTIA